MAISHVVCADQGRSGGAICGSGDGIQDRRIATPLHADGLGVASRTGELLHHCMQMAWAVASRIGELLHHCRQMPWAGSPKATSACEKPKKVSRKPKGRRRG
mmetsp:Transcript_48235/g.112847  ORF Transcript_48235/g.112847 Transcript_48235/m.112847 type:complete len:102 (-) Transcript_48235:3-308(-)